MTANRPVVSVIIPTHNRSTVLRRTLDSLCAQTYDLGAVEVLVVVDGCMDNTVEMLRQYAAPFLLRVLEQPRQGPATARNHGAARATGHIFLFLDDDIEAAPELIEVHVRAHGGRQATVVVGYHPPVLAEQRGFFRIELRRWWEDMFSPMRQPGHRYRYRDLLSGNCSLEAELFIRVGGFDANLWCHEDYELGVRLLKAGAILSFAPAARGHHHEKTDLARSLKRKYDEGKADVLIGRRHPELSPVLPLARTRATRFSFGGLLECLAFASPAVGDILATALRGALNLLESLRLRRRWRRLLDHVLVYWYWKGVAVELGTREALAGFFQSVPNHDAVIGHEIELDLSEGLEPAEKRLDEERPAGAVIRFGQHPVGRIPATPGAEALRGIHLRPILATTMAWPLVKALAADRAIDRERLPATSPAHPSRAVHAQQIA